MKTISLRMRLTLLFGGPFLIVILATSFAIDRLVASRIMRNNGEALHSLAQSMAKAIATNLEEREREIKLLASSRTLTTAPLDSAEIRDSLDITKRTYAYYAWIGIATSDDKIVAASNGVLEGQSASAAQNDAAPVTPASGFEAAQYRPRIDRRSQNHIIA